MRFPSTPGPAGITVGTNHLEGAAMARDIFHQVLAKLLEAAGGNPRQMVSMLDLLRQEKLFGSYEMIVDKLQGEGWIADAPKKDHFYVTTWGIQEVKRTEPGAKSPDSESQKEAAAKAAAAYKDAAARARELAAVLDELAAGGGDAEKKAKAKKALAGLTSTLDSVLG